MSKPNNNIEHADLVIINDNNLNFLGGERESQLIIVNGVKNHFKTAIIQPGEFLEPIEGVNVYWITKCLRMKQLIKRPFSFLTYIFKLGSLIKKISPKVIHSNSQVSFFMVSLLKRFRLISRDITLIHTDRGLYTKYSGFFRWLFQYSFKYLDILVTTTKFNGDCWKEANKKKNATLIYKTIGNTAGEIYETIDETRVSNNEYLTIGFAGRMCDWKGWPLAEDICIETEKMVSNAHYKMYVSCFDETAENETKKMFARMAERYGERFEGKINVPFVEMEQFYYDTDVYILTSWPKSESFGRTIVEAMSRYTAVLTTDAGGAVEVVNDPCTVCESAVDFAKVINDWDKNRLLLNEQKKKNLSRVKSEYTLDKNVENYKKLYFEFMNRKGNQ